MWEGDNGVTILIERPAGTGEGNTATADFDNADLTAGVYTFNHALGVKFLAVSVYDNNDIEVTPDDITATDTNNTAIDLSSYGTISGTWNVRGVG